MRRSAAMKRLNVLFSASPACVLKKFNWPLSCASMSIASILPRNRRASTLTCTRKLEREATHRALSSESPPPGTIMCTCAEPQVCSTAVTPIRAPRRLGSAAIVSVVSPPLPSSAGCRARACSGRRCHAVGSAAYRRRESMVPARAPPCGLPAIGVTPHPDTSDNAGCRRSCTRSPYGRTLRSRSARYGRRAPPCDSARSHSSPSIAQGSHGRGWPHAHPGRDRGGCPRPPELVEPWPAALGRRRLLAVSPHTPAARRAQVLQGALDFGNHSGRHATVACRRLEPLVSKQRLNDANVRAALEQVGREAVAKRMQRDRLAQPRGFCGLLEQSAELTRGQWLILTATWKQPALIWRNAGVIRGRPRLPPLPQQLQDRRRQHHVPVLAALRLHNADDLLLTVDVARSQPHHLAGPQPATIGQGQHRSHLQAHRHGQYALDLLRAQHRRQPLGLLDVPDLGRQIVAT